MREPCYYRALKANLFGLALSGGGIRSATFSLGILERLAELGLLSQIDYLSTVSGGGYIGAWLASWIQRASLPVVETNIRTDISPISDEARPVRFLREYSQYLAPEAGLFTADAWTMASIFFRNLLLNQVVILLSLGALLALPLCMIGLIALARQQQVVALACIAMGALLGGWACFQSSKAVVARGVNGSWRQTNVLERVVAPLLLSCLLVASGTWGVESNHPTPFAPLRWRFLTFAFLAISLAFPHFSAGWKAPYLQTNAKFAWIRHLSVLVIASAVATVFFLIPRHILRAWSLNTFRGDWSVVVFGPSLMLLAYGLAATFYIGIAGRKLSDGRREWWGRLGAWMALSSVGWLLLSAISIFGPEWVYSAHPATKLTLSSVWAAISWVGTKFASSSSTGSGTGPSLQDRIKEAIAAIAPYAFIGGLLVISSLGVQLFCEALDIHWQRYLKHVPALWMQWHGGVPFALASIGLLLLSLMPSAKSLRWAVVISGSTLILAAAAPFVWALYALPALLPNTDFRHLFSHYWASLNLHPAVPLIVFCVCVGAALLLSTRIDVNEFSLHHFYRNRLVRAFLGASRERNLRRPNPFTGFDERDDISLSSFTTANGYLGPLPILNAALNVTKGQDLATQERKAESFTFTPLRTGFDFSHPQQHPSKRAISRYGYQKTCWRAFGRYRGIRLGTAMAISGAAINPNMGYHSKPSIAFLLGLFNVRLGQWIKNPAETGSTERTSPRLGLLYLLRELGGYTEAGSSYVNVSDGGHFENMGLYELVRRRCRYIIVCDGEEDPKFNFSGIGGAIRKCRTDFGAEITLDPRQIEAEPGKLSKVHCAIGTIRYKEARCKTGFVLYIKTSLTGDEPTDVLEYQKRCPAFPNQSTADQFFTESQFESYRSLGYHAMNRVMEPVGAISIGPHWKRKLFETLQKDWKADIADPKHFDNMLWTASSAEQKIALIHRAYKELGLATRSGREMNIGVIQLFRSWKSDAAVGQAWSTAENHFDLDFKTFFCEQL